MYEISFNLFGRKGPKRNISGDVKQLGRMGVFISGSSFSVNHDLGDEFGFQLETPDGTPAFFEVDEGSTQDFGNVTEVFKPNFDGKGVVKIVIFGGNFELSDLSIKPASSTGFSPNFVQVIAPVPELTSERPDNYEFVRMNKSNGYQLSASAAYKLIGNAVPPLLGYHIAQKLDSIWENIFLRKYIK